MAILVDAQTRVCVQGITGRAGRMQARYMLEAGTRIVSGVTPGKGGEEVEGVPVFNTMAEAQAAAPAEVSILFVPPAVAESAATQALEAGIRLLVLITEGVPVHSTMRLRARARAAGARLIGPTTPGIIAPGRTKIGIMPARFYSPGPVGLISRSGTLSYEIGAELSAAGLGQSTVVGLGADPVVGTGMAELLQLFAADPETEAVVLVGEVGGTQEEGAARFAATMDKPVVAYIAGHSVPPGVRMGHAGAIVQGGTGSAAEKLRALEAAGVRTARQPGQVAGLVREALRSRRKRA
ncbi:MAG: succinate--CoA ligase subunit alpha [Candidatus Latescibacteria bacterium]|nr:succinate--CoA ligase subunit alpha [Candidatus Latescibacterota bacterium]